MSFEQRWMAYNVPESHAAFLRTLLGIKDENEPLPDSVRKAYYEHRRMLDKLGETFPISHLAIVMHNAHEKLDETDRTPGAEWREVEIGSPVSVGRRQGSFTGLIRNARNGEYIVKCQFGDEEGEYPPAKVKLIAAQPVGAE